jgi:hypothetical protein
MDRFGRHHDRLAAREYGCRLRHIGITGAQVSRLKHEFARQQILRVLGGEPAAILGDADRHDFILLSIDCVENGRGREQRDFVFAAAPAEKNSNSKLFHDDLVCTGRQLRVNRWDGSGRSLATDRSDFHG